MWQSFAMILGGIALGGTLYPAFGPVGNTIQQITNSLFRNRLLEPETLTRAYFRGVLKTGKIYVFTHLPDGTPLKTPLITTSKTAADYFTSKGWGGYERYLEGEEALREELHKWGYNDEKIDTTIAAAKYFPTPDDLIRMAVREAWTPEIAEKFGQYQDFPKKFAEMAKKVGMDEEVAKWYWAAHWTLPSASQGYEMLWRLSPDMVDFFRKRYESMGLDPDKLKFDLDTLRLLLRALDVMPFWRDKLIAISYAPITRVDIRRFEDLGLMSPEELEKRYRELGYSPEDARKLVTFTMVLNRKDEFRAALRSGAMTVNDLRNELRKLGVPEDGIERWVRVIVPPAKKEKLQEEKNLTKTEIIKGVKAGIIKPDEAVKMLMSLGYDEAEAEYILAIHLISMKGDPETPLEMRRAVELQKKAMGLPYKEIPQELVDREKELLELKQRLKEAEQKGDKEAIEELGKAVAEKEYAFRQLLAAHGLL